MRVIEVKANKRQLFHHWMEVTFPLHKLGKKEQSVFAELLFYRDALKEKVNDEVLLNKLIFDHEVKVKIMNTLDITQNRLALALTKLRKQGAIMNRTINKSYLPDINNNKAVMAYKFSIIDDVGSKEEVKEEV